MSDLEDEEVILDDIKLLQAVLTQKQTAYVENQVQLKYPIPVEHNLCEPSTSETPDIVHLSTSNTLQNLTTVDPLSYNKESENECDSGNEEDEKEEEEGEENTLADLSDTEAALNLNRKIFSLLSTTQKRLQIVLRECKRRQALIGEKVRQRTSDPFSRTLLTVAGIPYFKDKQQFPAPQNQDSKLKASRGELQLIDLTRPLRWTLKDRNLLWEAIYWNAKSISQEETKRRESREPEILLNNAEDPLRLDYKFRDKKIPEEMLENIKQLVGPLGSKEFDWMKISVTDFNGRHSATECRAMWNTFLHPDINKGKWKKNEDSDLKTLAEEYNFQNWDMIASRLGTSRSGYQCFIRFNTHFKNNMFSKISSWSKEEDQKLTDTINALRTGNFIPWGEVTKLIGNRRKQQIYMRWNYSLAPKLKKGRFTEEEDRLLLQGVAQFGANFTKISIALLPHRNTAQLNDHYRTLMHEKKNDWSCEDDMKLVNLVDKFGNNWSAIAKEFSNKSRVQVRHRHTAILRYLSRGHSIRTIPRWGKKTEVIDSSEEIGTDGEQILNEMSEMMRLQHREKEAERKEQLPKIDLQLRDYFKAVYLSSSKPGRNRKYYTPEELDEKTRKLHVILNMLDADLDIPDDSEKEVTLTEKDKQLLISLETYVKPESLEFETKQKYIEDIRQKMFGASMPSTEADRFIPPLPFNGKAQRFKRKELVGINYLSSGDKCLVKLAHKFNTSEEIISLLGGLENEIEFQNLEQILIGKTKQSPVNLSSTNTGNENSFVGTFDRNIPSTSSRIITNECRNVGQEILTNTMDQSSQIISKRRSKYYPEMLIPPNYVTLLGFRGILLSKHILEAEETKANEYEQNDLKMTLEGKEALELFEKRLVKLFKFPIELSEIPPPILHGSNKGEFDDIDSNSCGKKRKPSKKTSSELGAKKKAKLDEVNITETSQTE